MIYVFKTSVKSKKDVKSLTAHLNEYLTDGTWNFDLDDCDNILRIKGDSIQPHHVIAHLEGKGHQCSVLE